MRFERTIRHAARRSAIRAFRPRGPELLAHGWPLSLSDPALGRVRYFTLLRRAAQAHQRSHLAVRSSAIAQQAAIASHPSRFGAHTLATCAAALGCDPALVPRPFVRRQNSHRSWCATTFPSPRPSATPRLSLHRCAAPGVRPRALAYARTPRLTPNATRFRRGAGASPSGRSGSSSCTRCARCVRAAPERAPLRMCRVRTVPSLVHDRRSPPLFAGPPTADPADAVWQLEGLVRDFCRDLPAHPPFFRSLLRRPRLSHRPRHGVAVEFGLIKEKPAAD